MKIQILSTHSPFCRYSKPEIMKKKGIWNRNISCRAIGEKCPQTTREIPIALAQSIQKILFRELSV